MIDVLKGLKQWQEGTKRCRTSRYLVASCEEKGIALVLIRLQTENCLPHEKNRKLYVQCRYLYTKAVHPTLPECCHMQHTEDFGMVMALRDTMDCSW
jgi:hypothetical protein